MNRRIMTLEELKDSKLLYDKRVPAFGYMIIITVLLLLFFVIGWSVFAPKIYMINSSGIVESADMNLQVTQLEEQKKFYAERITQLEKLVQSIKDDTNYFDAISENDSLYFSQFEAYKSQILQNQADIDTFKAYGYSEEQIEAQGQVDGMEAQLLALEQGAGEDVAPYIKVEVEPDSKYLISKEGDKINITNGMTVETRIQYDKVTYFNYVMEALGVLTR